MEAVASMAFQVPDMTPALPEIFVLTMACIILVVDVFLPERRRALTYLLSLATLAGAGILTLALHEAEPRVTFGGSFVADTMADVLKVFIYLVVATVFVYSRRYLAERGLFRGEFFTLGLFAVLGMMVMVSARSLLTLYLGLELLSLSLYAMVALQRDSARAAEAAMKYFVLGALASGILLYGMSVLYGVAGTLDLAELGAQLSGPAARDPALVYATVFVLVGLGFKLGAVPFHMWVPDIYHGSATAVTVFIGTAPKMAGFALLIRLLAEGMQGLHVHWGQLLIVLAVLSMAVGNVVAIAQRNLKRMLAYSAIAHAGYLLLGIVTGSAEGYAASMFYVIVYAIMSLGAFGMILLLSRQGFEADHLEDFKGLNERSPWLAFIMAVLMFSMAGIPPFLGFWAKFTVLQAVVRAELVWLAVVGVVFAIVGAYYYLRVVKLMYFDRPQGSAPLPAGGEARFLVSVNGLAVLLLGIYPTGLMALCAGSFAAGG